MSPTSPRPKSILVDTKDAALAAVVTALRGDRRVIVKAQRNWLVDDAFVAIAVQGMNGARGLVQTLVHIRAELGDDRGLELAVSPGWFDEPYACDFKAFPDWLFFHLSIFDKGGKPSDELLQRVATAATSSKDLSRDRRRRLIGTASERAPRPLPQTDVHELLAPIVAALSHPHVVIPEVTLARDGFWAAVAVHGTRGASTFFDALRRLTAKMGFRPGGISVDVSLVWHPSVKKPRCDFERWPDWLVFGLLIEGVEGQKGFGKPLLDQVAKAIGRPILAAVPRALDRNNVVPFRPNRPGSAS